MNLEDYSTEELKAELKRRNAKEKAKRASILRCRMCKYWGEVNYWGVYVGHSYGNSRPCRFFKTTNGNYYRSHRASELACDHSERNDSHSLLYS